MRTSRWWVRGLAGVVLLGLAWGAWQVFTWPDVRSLGRRDPQSTAFIDQYRAERRRAGAADAVAWSPVPYARISVHLKRAVLVAEDIDFFSHKGFAVEEMKLAVREAWDEKELPRGASTITQQLAKNLFLSPSRSPWRKAKEALLTRQLERQLNKRRIFELYLNCAEFGPGVYGADAAARRYFGKPAATLDEREAAELAAALPRPRTWRPGANSRAYQRRVAIIQGRMERATWLWDLL